jgi:hypothetical protein
MYGIIYMMVLGFVVELLSKIKIMTKSTLLGLFWRGAADISMRLSEG